MNDKKKSSIPVSEFLKLGNQARKAYKAGDLEEVGRINARLNEINASLFWKDGECYIFALNSDNPLPMGGGDND